MPAVQFDVVDTIAVITFDQPGSRVNLMSTDVWNDLDEILEPLWAHTELRGLMLRSAKPGMFVAGADLKELREATPENLEPTENFLRIGLHVLAMLEEMPFPTVAAIDGYALGGGFEIALACDFRVSGNHARCQLGLPEIKLGLIPGWGGSQRLTRIVGCAEALDRLLSGEPYRPTDSGFSRIVDQVTDSAEVEAAAFQILQERAEDSGLRRDQKEMELAPEERLTDEEVQSFRERIAAMDVRHQPAALELLDVVCAGSALPLLEAEEAATNAFLRLAGREPSKSLIAEFFGAKPKV